MAALAATLMYGVKVEGCASTLPVTLAEVAVLVEASSAWVCEGICWTVSVSCSVPAISPIT